MYIWWISTWSSEGSLALVWRSHGLKPHTDSLHDICLSHLQLNTQRVHVAWTASGLMDHQAEQISLYNNNLQLSWPGVNVGYRLWNVATQIESNFKQLHETEKTISGHLFWLLVIGIGLVLLTPIKTCSLFPIQRCLFKSLLPPKEIPAPSVT